jgi:hypothetical protein
MSKALRLWIAEEKMVLNEIEYVLHEAGKRLYLSRDLVSGIPVPTESLSELTSVTRPDGSVWGGLYPQSRLLGQLACPMAGARCLPRQYELHQRLLKETCPGLDHSN